MPPKKPTASPAEPPASPPGDSPAKETESVSLRKPASHPSTTIMIKEALKQLDSRSGVSSHAIQSYIKQNYPTADGIRLKYLVARALKRGLENGTLVRPAKSSEAAGLTGKFRLSPKTRQKVKTENADPNVSKSSKPAKEEVKKPKKAGVSKKRDSKEQTDPQEDSKSPKKSKADEAAAAKSAPRKKPKAKTKAEKDGEGASGSKSKPAKAKKTAKVGAAATKTGKQGKKSV